MEVKCPNCGKPALFSPENKFRPFCCERCKLIDLGAWAEGKYAIPVKEVGEEELAEAEAEAGAAATTRPIEGSESEDHSDDSNRNLH